MKTPTLESFFEVGGIHFKVTSIEDKTVEVAHKKYENSVVIPSTIDYNGTTYAVTTIGESACYGCRSLNSITIPNSVTTIGYGAFHWCRGLTSIVIPDSVTEIGESAFECSGLKSIVIPNSVTIIGESAFYGCSGLTSIVIPNSVTAIGKGAFHGCSELESIVIPDSVTSIGDYAFINCRGLTNIVIPDSVSAIGKKAFAECRGLKSIISHIPADKLFPIEWTVFLCEEIDKSYCKLYVPKGAKVVYAKTDGWRDFKNIEELKE